MKLVVHELGIEGTAELIQQVSSDRNTILYAIRPHLYRHNFPTGSLKVQVLDDSDDVVAESETLSIADISPGSNFYHGYVRFYINGGLSKDRTYKIKLVGTGGYIFDESAYVGWCNDYDLQKYPRDYTPSGALTSPLDLEIWERKTK
jgi:hypothetical protein